MQQTNLFPCVYQCSNNTILTLGFTTTGSRHESARNRRSSLWQGPSAIKALYSLLLEPMEDEFPEEGSEIMLVLESNLFMVRFFHL